MNDQNSSEGFAGRTEPFRAPPVADFVAGDRAGAVPAPAAFPHPAAPHATTPNPGFPHPATPHAGFPLAEPAKRTFRGRVVAGAAALAILAGGVGGVIGYGLADGGVVMRDGGNTVLAQNSSQPRSEAADGSVQSVAAKVLPSVVSIRAVGDGEGGEGSGVVLSADGLILTNNHVIAPAGNGGEVTVAFHDGSRAKARIVGADPRSDVAVLRVEGRDGLTPIRLGSSANLSVGQPVVAIGSPLGLSGTVTQGIVSALDRPVRAGGERTGEETVLQAIQTDAAINPGNSGGALVNMAGDLVGINTAIARIGGGSQQSGSIGLGFALPVDQAKRIADQLIEKGSAEHAQLGVKVEPVRESGGVRVVDVVPGSAADAAGIREDGVITSVDGRKVDDPATLVAAIRARGVGDTVTLGYRDGGAEKTVEVVLRGER